jgi:hypothetical protein
VVRGSKRSKCSVALLLHICMVTTMFNCNMTFRDEVDTVIRLTIYIEGNRFATC